MQTSDLKHWQHIADKMADKYNKAYNVIANDREILGVFPATLEPRGINRVVYTVGGSEDVSTDETTAD